MRYPKTSVRHRNPVCARTYRRPTSMFVSEIRTFPLFELPNSAYSQRTHGRKCATTYRSLIGSRTPPNRHFRTGLSQVRPLLPLPVNLRTTRPHEPTMGSNASTDLGSAVNYGIRDMRRLQTGYEQERPTEHPEKSNRKSHQQFPVSPASHHRCTPSSWIQFYRTPNSCSLNGLKYGLKTQYFRQTFRK